MCGFAGFHSTRVLPPDAAKLARAMADRLTPRGPDSAGQWADPAVATALGFRRLAIVELSELGSQPMLSSDGRYAFVMNGEIYNHRELRKELEAKGRFFRGHSDAEVLLEAVAEWGLEASLKRCVGMYALAVVDRKEKRLQLARDRMGEKPLYYGWSNGHFFFGSELKAFRPHPGFTAEVDREALTHFLRLGYVPSPHSILSGFHKLLQGHILTLPLDGSATPGKETVRPYWSVPKPGELSEFTGSPQECVNELEALMRDAIRLQMLADVPVGAFLSGGIDSSTVVSLMQAQAPKSVKTFSIGFPDAPYDESDHAETIARHLGTEHVTWQCEDAELLELAGKLPQAYSEPFADDSQLPTLALSRLARRKVTVSLSGDGGDEVFLGYGRYDTSLQRWKQIQRNGVLRGGIKGAVDGLSALVGVLPDSAPKRRWKSQLARARRQWSPDHLAAFYRHRFSLIKTPDLYLSRQVKTRDFFDQAGELPEFRDEIEWFSYMDKYTYLPDDILVKVDRAAMAFSLETRVPILDHRVVEFAARIPRRIMRNEGKTKWPLRQILDRHVPRELTERGKMGFSTPMNRWLRTTLRDWAEALLAEDRLRREGFFDAQEMRRLWHEQQSGKRERGYMLWAVLMFQAWKEAFWERI